MPWGKRRWMCRRRDCVMKDCSSCQLLPRLRPAYRREGNQADTMLVVCAQGERALNVPAASDVVEQREGRADAAVADGDDDAAHRDCPPLVLGQGLAAGPHTGLRTQDTSAQTGSHAQQSAISIKP